MEPDAGALLPLHRKTKGDVAEAFVTYRLLALGKTVLRRRLAPAA